MKLRSHLVILVLAVLLPSLIFIGVMGVLFWRHQRAVYDRQYLDRVRALATAVDREQEGHARALQVLGQSLALQRGDLALFYEQAQRVAADHRAWDSVVLAEPTGAQVFNLRRPFGTPLPPVALDPAFLAAAAGSGRPMMSPLVTGSVSHTQVTVLVVPVRRGRVVTHLLMAVLEPRVWLDLLARQPNPPGATMTLLDQNRIIVARTLNHERWVGKPPSPGLSDNVQRAPELAARNVGLEGRLFYSAHSRLPFSGWTLATGVPADIVERELRESAIAMAVAALLMLALAIALALVFGRRIARPVAELARSVARFGAGEPATPLAATGVDEVAAVARAFNEAAKRLSARETAERAARAEAETANRMKDEFLAILSHELRTPINAVFGWARMLRSGGPAAKNLAHGLEVIERNAASQVRLIEDLLDVSRIASGKMRLDVRLVDVRAAIEGALEAVRHAAHAKEIRLDAVLDPHAGPVAGDLDRLRQVVWNLLSNAIKFTPKGGRVQVRLARVGSRVQIVVADTGPGIPPELLPHVFERFRQGDSTSTRTQAGLGLGLALVKHIVELHGGDVRAETADGSGAVFTVELPLSLAATPALGHAPHPTAALDGPPLPSVSLAGVRVLLVDDDRDALDLFRSVLEPLGAETRTAASTAEALRLFAEWRPTVLLSDIEMPGQDGYALIAAIRTFAGEDGGNVPAAAVTAYGRVEDRVRLLEAGYNMHLPKPVEPAELVAVVAALGRRAGSA
ncbi:MAG TPA: ATP-binding protein [Terriglobales bacterium]|nr:ATP-binding protein [Terriglobales bacterium]